MLGWIWTENFGSSLVPLSRILCSKRDTKILIWSPLQMLGKHGSKSSKFKQNQSLGSMDLYLKNPKIMVGFWAQTLVPWLPSSSRILCPNLAQNLIRFSSTKSSAKQLPNGHKNCCLLPRKIRGFPHVFWLKNFFGWLPKSPFDLPQIWKNFQLFPLDSNPRQQGMGRWKISQKLTLVLAYILEEKP